MAEIQVGMLTNVPNASPLTSGWAKDISRMSTHNFVNKAALDAVSNPTNWPGLANGALAVTLDTNVLWERISGVWKEVVRSRGASVYRTVDHGVPNAIPEALQWDGQRHNSSEGYFNPGDPIHFTVPAGLGGVHSVTFNIGFPPHDTLTGTRAAWIIKEGTATRYAQTEAPGQFAGSTCLNGATMLNLIAGDKLVLYAFHNLGGGWVVSKDSSFSIARLGALG